jgi:hypothetical protein
MELNTLKLSEFGEYILKKHLVPENQLVSLSEEVDRLSVCGTPDDPVDSFPHEQHMVHQSGTNH